MIINLENILANYSHLGKLINISQITTGLINQTFLIHTNKTKFILQKLSPIFPESVNLDLISCSDYLKTKNMISPEIIKTNKNKIFINFNNFIFRALKFIPGVTYSKISSPKLAEQAGIILGKFHTNLKNFNYDFKCQRFHAGAYSYYLENFKKALKNNSQHIYYKKILSLGEKLYFDLEKINLQIKTTPRPAHGDPKISNIIFNKQDQAVCLIDFDTLGNHGWSLELADAMRSWANTNQEDNLASYINLEILENSLLGYASINKDNFTLQEQEEFLLHLPAITLCLALRYAADTLNENYFAFDSNSFQRPAEHNFLRAQAMRNLAQDIVNKIQKIEKLVYNIFS